ncbi:MAG: GNAT family N-acetyltransferase [Lactobacillaceae bacterium]|jgi:GNAT superfamily N-acetyltransferase|nr:GNAT family N-acetyltransferase [Lactobacillaceae bacterium]
MDSFVELTKEKLPQEGFIFDWELAVDANIVVGLLVDDEIVGIIAFQRITEHFYNLVALVEVREPKKGQGYGAKLLAMVMTDSFEQGFEGYIKLKTKTNGVQYFYSYLGATLFGQLTIFNAKTSYKVINKYLPDGGLIEWNMSK